MKKIVSAALMVAAVLTPAAVAAPAHALTDTSFPYLSRGLSLFPPNTLTNPMQNAYYVVMQDDGNLVEYGTSSNSPREGACWSTGTSGHQGAYATYENSGSLVITDETGRITLWSSHTDGPAGKIVNVTNTGALWIGVKEVVGPEPGCNGPSPS
jgi:hypothetical protein